MARFSIGTAINDAFSLMRRRPLSVFVWGLLLIGPMVGSVGIALPILGSAFANIERDGGGDGVVHSPMAEMMQFQALSGLMNILQLFLAVFVYTAIMRAVLRPRESSFFSLRVGMDELRIAVVGLAMIVGIYFAAFVIVLIGVAIGFSVWHAGSPTNWLVITGLIAMAILAIWVAMARVSLIAPASVLYRTFAFPEGWRLGRGQTGALFGLMLLVMLLVMVIEAVVFGIGLAVSFSVGAFGSFDWTGAHAHNMDVNPFAGLSTMFAANWPWVALAVVVVAMVYGAALTLTIAPFASACRQLAEGETPSRVDEHSPAPAA